MPDATITSTASTFGTITGTFAADQSTVTGTITGTVTGTLTGSVGVPGPAGVPGQGVPVGGSAGQFLTKIDGTNYNTDWTTVNLSVYAVKANNLSDLADAPTARTNLGLGTMATATAADYSTTTVANGLYYPLSGNPSGFLTSVPPPTLTNLTSDISWDGSANTGRLLIAGVNDIGGGNTEARLNFTSGVPTQPATGDFWTNGTDFFYRESGSTKTIASQSYVSANYQPLSGMSSYLTTASAAATYFTIASAASKADLASPTFTGTPTLPTGTIATTQSPGNNTTAVATTAFVTAAVPAFATETEAIVGTSSTTTISPLTMRNILSNAGYTAHTSLVGNFSSYVSGAASVSNLWSNFVGLSVTGANGKVAFLPNSLVSYFPFTSRGKAELNLDWTKPIWFSFRFNYSSAAGIGDSNTVNRVTIGKQSSVFGNLASKGFGVTWTAGTAGAFTVSAHNGTTLTSVASAVTVSNTTYFPTTTSAADFLVYSDGAGNITLFCNGVQVATTTGGPSSGNLVGGRFTFEADNTTSTSGNVVLDFTGIRSMYSY